MNVLKITALTVMGLSVSGCGEQIITALNIEGGNRTGAERFVDAGRASDARWPPCLFRHRTTFHSCGPLQPRYGYS